MHHVIVLSYPNICVIYKRNPKQIVIKIHYCCLFCAIVCLITIEKTSFPECTLLRMTNLICLHCVLNPYHLIYRRFREHIKYKHCFLNGLSDRQIHMNYTSLPVGRKPDIIK